MLRSGFKRPWEPVVWLVTALWAWGLSWWILSETPSSVEWAAELRFATLLLCLGIAITITVWYPTALMNTLTGGRRERS